ncbi:MAG: transporter [Nitrospiraceae bacterium]
MNRRTGLCALIVSMLPTFIGFMAAPPAQASCGSVTCFVIIGSQQQVPQKGLLTVNGIYNYTPMRVQNGISAIIPAVEPANRLMILDHHQEIQTITQTYTLNLNYGVTERFGFEVNLPFLNRQHKHMDGLGEDGVMGEGEMQSFSDNGLGDIRLTAKYNVLPTLRSMVVAGFGVDLPSGKHNQTDSTGEVTESSIQLGRGQVGLIGSIYQTYELIPHKLNQMAFASYRHTFRNNEGYQFGDEYLFNVGLNYIANPWLTLMGQFNYRYLVHDNQSASLEASLTPADPGFPGPPNVIDPDIKDRRVPSTGSTFLAFTPGFQLNVSELVKAPWAQMTSLYFYSQIPVARDANNNLTQGTSFVFGLTRSFQVMQ